MSSSSSRDTTTSTFGDYRYHLVRYNTSKTLLEKLTSASVGYSFKMGDFEMFLSFIDFISLSVALDHNIVKVFNFNRENKRDKAIQVAEKAIRDIQTGVFNEIEDVQRDRYLQLFQRLIGR